MKEDILKPTIASLLNEAGGSLMDKEIAALIKKRKLWTRRLDGEYPEASQIRLRVNSDPEMFSLKNGVVKLEGSAVDKFERLCRLTHNERAWMLPSGHKWTKAKQKRKDVAFENQYGFGGEEWLFNPIFLEDGYHYGYIRGLLDLPIRVSFVPKICLFSLDQKTSERYFVGILSNVEIIRENKAAMKVAKRLADKNDALMRNDLRNVEADLAGFRDGQVPFVRFKQADVEFFDKQIPISSLKGRQYNRFIPYKINARLREIFAGAVPPDEFVLRPGRGKTSGSHIRTTTARKSTVERLHDDITEDLYDFLRQNENGYKNVSVEQTRFGPNIADCVAEHANGQITVLEVKTSANLRKNIREALGQLLDYALWYEKPKISALVVISPLQLEGAALSLFLRLQKTINIKLEYWQYVRENALAERFVMQG